MPSSCSKLMCLWVIALAPSFAQTPALEDNPETTIKVDVRLVNVFTTVTDQTGAPIAKLERKDFEVLEDDVPQTISVFGKESELPLSIVLAIDASLSTKKDLPLELESAKRFARSILRPVDALSLYRFAETVHELVPFTSNLKRIDSGIGRVKVGAATALYDAVYLASEALESRQGRKVLVVITDGGDTISDVSYAEALRQAQASEAVVYSIIVVPIEASAGRNTGGEHALIQLSHDTGGKYFYAASGSQLEEVFKQISDELRTQYLLAYYPKQRPAAGEFRRIEVRVSGQAGDTKVRHRTGYYVHKSK
ncbi:MAG: VWA domain-containing protein [Acidobacteriales bacterium]|nr:VWA domain-containing protein [Terriglobales bacterium]